MNRSSLIGIFICISLTDPTSGGNELGRDKLVEFLRFSKAIFSANALRIETWTGTVTGIVKERVASVQLDNGKSIAGPLTRHAEFKQDFKLDLSKRVLFSNYEVEVTGYLGKNSKIDVSNSPLVFQCISSPEHFVRFELTSVTGTVEGFDLPPFLQEGRTIERLDPRDAELALHSCMFDPRAYFLLRDSRPLQDYFQSLIDASSSDHFPVRASISGEPGERRLRLEIAYSGPEELEVVEHYDERYSFCCVQQDRKSKSSGVMLQSVKMKYEKSDGISLPVHMVMLKADKDGLVMERELVYRNNGINTYLPDAQFELNALDVQAGDRFVDRLENKLLVVNANGRLVPPGDYFKSKSRFSFGLMLAIVILVMILGSVRLVRKRFLSQ